MRKEMARGAAWMVLLRLFDRSVGIISTAILARLLVPADFGLVAMAMTVIAVVELATAFGFDMALVQKTDPKREHFDTAWTLNVLFALGCAAVIALAAWPAARFYGDERLAPLLVVIATAWSLSGFENTGTANFRREMNFAAEFRFMAIKRVLGFVATLMAALILRSYWALVIGMIAGRLSGVVLSFVLHPFRPRFSLSKVRELFGFSGWLLINNFLGVFINKISHLYVGRTFGAQAIGNYSVSAEIAQMTHTELIAPINRALFPGYSRLISNPTALRETCLGATSVIMLLVIPVSVGTAALAGPFVRLLLGPQWGDAVELIQVLALAGALTALTSNNLAVYLALGKPNLATAILFTRLTVLVVAMTVLASRFGVKGAAYAEVLAAGASMLVSLPTLLVTLRVRLTDYLRGLWRPVVAGAIMGYAIHVVVSPQFDASNPAGAFGQLFGGVGLGLGVYLTVIGVLWWLAGRPHSIEAMLTTKFLEMIRSRFGRSAPAP